MAWIQARMMKGLDYKLENLTLELFVRAVLNKLVCFLRFSITLIKFNLFVKRVCCEVVHNFGRAGSHRLLFF